MSLHTVGKGSQPVPAHMCPPSFSPSQAALDHLLLAGLPSFSLKSVKVERGSAPAAAIKSWGFSKSRVFNFEKMQSIDLILLYRLCFCVVPKNSLLNPRSKRLSLMLSSSSFMGLGFACRPMVYFELLFV